MNADMNIHWRYQEDDDSDYSYDSDSSVYSDDTSTSGISDYSNFEDVDENCKTELQRLLDSTKPSDKDNLNAKVIDIVKQDSKMLFMYLIANNYKLEVLNEKGQTALHLASYHADDVLKLIVNFPNFVTENHTDCNGYNYLHIASSLANEKLVRRCLKAGVNVNAQLYMDPKGLRSKFTPLHYAASTMLLDSKKIIKLLVKNGANVNATDYLGRTPLHIACRVYEELFVCSESLDSCSSLEFMKILLKSGSDPNARDNFGNTALLSIAPDNLNEFKFEEDEDANSLPYGEIQEKLKFFLRKGVDFSAINNDGNNILHRIIENLKLSRYPNEDSVDFSYDTDYAKMIKKILKANTGIDVNAKNVFGDSPLQLAVSLMSFDIVKVLLEYNADINDLTFSHDDEYCFCCPNVLPNLDVTQQVISIIKLLLKNGWKLNFKNNLNLMKFLVHKVDYCECGNTSTDGYDIHSNVLNLIDYGSVEHFEETIAKVINDLVGNVHLFSRELVIEEMCKALHYRKIFHLYVDKEIIEIAKIYQPGRWTFDELVPNSAKNDVVRMKYTKLKGDTTLYDVMSRHPHRIYRYVKNRNFDKITEHFQYLDDMVKGHVAKSLIRHHIEKVAVEYLRLLFSSSLPSLCSRHILSFLSNVEIVNMCSAAVLEEQ